MKAYIDLIFAGLITITSTAIASLAYTVVESREHAGSSSELAFQEGTKDYIVTQNNHCVGSFHTQLSHHSHFKLVVHGEIRVGLNSGTSTTEIEGAALFNPIRQLVESNLKIHSPGVEVQIETGSTNPVNISFTMQNGSSQRSSSLSIPGPIELQHVGQGEYRVSGMRSLGQSSLLKPILTAFIGDGQIQVHPLHQEVNNSIVCNRNESSVLQLGPGVTQLQKFLEQFFLRPQEVR